MKVAYIFLILICFGMGAYAWKVVMPTHRRLQTSKPIARQQLDMPGVLVTVGPESITREDLDWELRLTTQGLEDREELTPIPDLGPNVDEQLKSLRTRLLSELVERKMLYEFITADQEFSREDPARYIDCLRDWNEITASSPELYTSEEDRSRLKQRLCEKSVLEQYIEERLFRTISISDKDVEAYYQSHPQEFHKPKRVVIRQVVTASERDAKRVRAKLRRHNFEEMARDFSIAPEADQGGLLGPFAKGDMPRTFDIAFRMRRGQISDIQKSTYGFHLIMLEQKLDEENLSLEEATPGIEARLRREAEEELYKKWVDQALSTIDVKTPKPLW